MRDRRQIVELHQKGNAIALATLVALEGSSYRRTGARLLIAGDGEYAGSISGGCLEAEVVRKAQWLVRSGATVQRYSTLFDDTAEIPYGLGCGGTVDILLEPANTPEFAALLLAIQRALHGERSRVATQLPGDGAPFRRCILNAAGEHIFSSADGLVDPNLPFFEEWMERPQRLILMGAGDDAQPVAAMAGLLGWSVAVLDGRAQWARAERFPQAEQVLATNSLDSLNLTPQDAVVIMTHSYEQDRAWLAAVLPYHPRYVGLLGARHRSALLVSEVAAKLGWPMDDACENLFAPVGLDLGGDGAEAIALAIIAEVQACISGKLGVSRRMTPEAVDEQLKHGGASRYLQAQCAV
jgi:xanthine dehydrogenase accessory factor